MGTLCPEIFYGEMLAGRDGPFYWLVLFTKAVQQYVNIPKVVVQGTMCITAPQCIHASKNRHLSINSPSFTPDITHLKELPLQWLRLLVINHNCKAAKMTSSVNTEE